MSNIILPLYYRSSTQNRGQGFINVCGGLILESKSIIWKGFTGQATANVNIKERENLNFNIGTYFIFYSSIF